MRTYSFLITLLMLVSFSMATHTSLTSGNLDTTSIIANTGNGLGLSVQTGQGEGINVSSGGGNAVSVINTGSGQGIYTEGNYGISAHGLPTYLDARGVEAQATGDVSYGVYASTYWCDYCYSLYAQAPGGGTQTDHWSGYFEGDVYVGGTFSNPSDAMFKKNVRALDGGLDKIMALKPRSYEMKTEEFKNRVYLPKGEKHGFIAQDLEKILPELVQPVTAPSPLTAEEKKNGVKKEPTKFKSIDYIGLIPILVQAIQDQQAEINALKNK